MARLPFCLSVASAVLIFSSIANAVKEVNVPAAQLDYRSGVWNFADTGRYCSQDHYWTRGTGSTVSYIFNGSAIAVHAFKFSDGAKVSIDIDGSKTTIDTHVTTYDCFSVIFNSGVIPYGRHTLTMTTLDPETFYVRGVTYATYDDSELASVAVASASSVAQASISMLSTASAASASASAASASSSPSTGAIAGGVVGGILALGVIVALIFFLMRRKKNKNTNAGGPGITTAPPTEAGWKPGATPSWQGQPLGYQPTGQSGAPVSPGSPYNGYLPNQPTGTTAAGVGYIGSQPTGTSTQERPMSAYSQPGYSMNPAAFHQPPTGVPSPAPSGAYQGHPIPMEYGSALPSSVSTSPAPNAAPYTHSPHMMHNSFTPEPQQQQPYGAPNAGVDPSRILSPAPAYDNGMYAPQAMYPRQ